MVARQNPNFILHSCELCCVDDVEELCEMKITLPSLLFYHELSSFKDEDEEEEEENSSYMRRVKSKVKCNEEGKVNLCEMMCVCVRKFM